MIDMGAFMADFLKTVCQIMMTEPVVYFISIAIVLCIAALVRRILMRGG